MNDKKKKENRVMKICVVICIVYTIAFASFVIMHKGISNEGESSDKEKTSMTMGEAFEIAKYSDVVKNKVASILKLESCDVKIQNFTGISYKGDEVTVYVAGTATGINLWDQLTTKGFNVKVVIDQNLKNIIAVHYISG